MPLTNTEYLSPDAQGGTRNEGRANHLPILLSPISRDFQFYLDKHDPDRSMNRQFYKALRDDETNQGTRGRNV